MVAAKSIVNTDPSCQPATLSIREIADTDIGPVINLLTRGFPHPRSRWEVRLERLRTRSAPPDMPRYGYVLETDGRPVGVLLLISSLRTIGNRQELFSNLSSWYVEPDYRGNATQLLKRALTNKQATYLSISPATHVRPIYEALRFKRYSEGQVLAVPALACNRQDQPARVVAADGFKAAGITEEEQRLLEIQAGYGCITSLCSVDGHTQPFVFVPRMIKGFIPCVQLVYCRDISDFVDVAGTVGRRLLRLGRPFVLIDADGPIAGIPGKYFPDKAPKYYKGSTAPARGDLIETEATIFGF